MNAQFKNIVDAPSPVVDAIIEKAMFHSKKEEARRFLTFMDNYLCFHLNRENEGICFPIIRIPSCPDWAREVFLKYLIYRLSIYYNQDSMPSFKPNKEINLKTEDPIDKRLARETRKRNKYVLKLEKYKNSIQKLNDQQEYLGKTGHKNLIFCTQNDLMVSKTDKNEFIEEFYGEPNDIFTEKNLCICHDMTARDIRRKIKEAKVEMCIDNIFVFFTNNDECKSLRKANLEKLNQSGKTGIKNCFIFEITNHPYRLNETLNRDKRLSYIYPGLGEKEYQSNQFFTSLTDEEAKYLFNPTIKDAGRSEHWHVTDVERLHETFFAPLIGTFTDNAEYWIQERNKFSLCLNTPLTNIYKETLKEYTSEMEEHIFDESFEAQKINAASILREIRQRLEKTGYNGKIALVVDFYTPHKMQEELKKLLQDYKVKIYSYKYLRPSKNGKSRILGNKIKESIVFVLRYRPHNAKSAFSNYPNSFDPFTTNPNQCVTEIIQDYIFIDKYLWDKYDYELEEYKCLNSLYRREVLGGFNHPVKPKINRVFGYEDPDEERSSSRQNVATIDITYENGRSCRLVENEMVIYQTEEEDKGIARLKDLKEQDVLNNVTAIQRLDDITEELSQAIIEKEQKDTELEIVTRSTYYSNGLITEEERDSNVYLWKILLRKKVEQTNQDQVYNEIMEPLAKSDQVQPGAFANWLDKNNAMMLPLQRTTQKRLMEYLGLSTAYLQLMRSKKMMEANKTRKNNNMLETFLANNLLSEIDEDVFDEFHDSKINDILQCNRIDDLKALIELLNEKVNLNKVISIS